MNWFRADYNHSLPSQPASDKHSGSWTARTADHGPDDTRDERDFGLETETETETRVVSRPVSSFETTCQKSQYQSQNLRLISKVSVSVSNFETTMQKSQSQSQNAMDGLAHHRFWDPQRKFILCQLFINFYVRMCFQSHIKLLFFSKSKVSVSVSMFSFFKFLVWN